MSLVVSYPMCNVSGHIHDDSTSSSTSHNIHDDIAQSPDSVPIPPEPFHVDESVATVPPLDNLNPTHQIIESFRVAATSLDQPTAAIQDNFSPGITMPSSEAYMPSHPHFSTSPPATSALSVSPGTSGSPPGAADDGDSLMPGLRKEKDSLDSPSVNRAIDENIAATLDLSLQSQPPSSVIDVAIAGRSLQEPNAGHTADHPPDPSRYRYDMV